MIPIHIKLNEKLWTDCTVLLDIINATFTDTVVEICLDSHQALVPWLQHNASRFYKRNNFAYISSQERWGTPPDGIIKIDLTSLSRKTNWKKFIESEMRNKESHPANTILKILDRPKPNADPGKKTRFLFTRKNDGLGDWLTCLSILKKLQDRDNVEIHVFCKDMPAVSSLVDGFRHIRKTEILQPEYYSKHIFDVKYDNSYNHTQNMADNICSAYKLPRISIELPFWDQFSSDKSSFDVVMMSQGKGQMPTKEWGFKNYNELCQKLVNRGLSVAQVGGHKDIRLETAADCRGMPFAQLATVLKSSKLFICEIGFLMVFAAAVDAPTLVIFSLRENPEISQYKNQTVLTSDCQQAFCWKYTCDVVPSCMSKISVDTVYNAAIQYVKEAQNS